MLASNLPLALAEMLVAVWLQRIEIHGDRDHAYINSFTARDDHGWLLQSTGTAACSFWRIIPILRPVPLHCVMRRSCDKNVIVPLHGDMAGQKTTKPEASLPGIFPAVGCNSLQRQNACPIDLYLYVSWQAWFSKHGGDIVAKNDRKQLFETGSQASTTVAQVELVCQLVYYEYPPSSLPQR